MTCGLEGRAPGAKMNVSPRYEGAENNVKEQCKPDDGRVKTRDFEGKVSEDELERERNILEHCTVGPGL